MPRIVVQVLAAAFAVLACGLAAAQAASSSAVAESAPLPPDQISQEIKDALAAADRPAADKALDAGRRPEQMLAFFGIRPGMKVAMQRS